MLRIKLDIQNQIYHWYNLHKSQKGKHEETNERDNSMINHID